MDAGKEYQRHLMRLALALFTLALALICAPAISRADDATDPPGSFTTFALHIAAELPFAEPTLPAILPAGYDAPRALDKGRARVHLAYPIAQDARSRR